LSKTSRPEANVVPEDDDLLQLRAQVQNDPVARGVYEDTVTRASVLAAGPASRRRKRLSQSQVAAAMGTTQSAVSDLEAGRVEPQLRTLQRYARALGRRLDVAIVDEDLPVFGQGAANELWMELEKTTWSPILTTLVTGIENRERRTLAALAESVLLPQPILDPILTTLQERGWASSAGSGGDRVYSLVYEAAYVIGVSLSKDRVVGVLLDLTGDVVRDMTLELQDTTSPTVVAATVSVVQELFAAREGRRVLGVGVTLAGIVHAITGRVDFAPDLQCPQDSWRGVELERELQRAVQQRVGDPSLLVAVDNDANAFAVREYLRRGDHSVMVLLLSGTGIGAGLVLEGHVARGSHHAAGEAGHLVVDPKGPPCGAGLRHQGCLETLASAQAILATLGIPAGSAFQLESGLDAANDRIREGDGKAAQVFYEAGEALGRFLASSIVLLDPTRAVLYAHPQLARSKDYESAREFQRGVQAGLGATAAGQEGLAEPARVEWHSLDKLTGATAAGAVVMRHFLARPGHWAPSMLLSRPERDKELV
jgi:glucokinase